MASSCLSYYLRGIAAMLLISGSLSIPCTAQVKDRQTLEGDRNKVIDWARRNGALIKGMTKGEVEKIYGRPDKRFTRAYSTGRVEQWTYHFPRKRSIFPAKDSQFSARYRFLYFRDDILVNFER